MHRRRSPDGLRANLGEANVAHVAGLDHLRDGPDGLFDGHCGVQPRRPVNVDVLHAQPLQRVGQRGLHSHGPRIITQPSAVGSSLRAKLY